MIICHSHKFVFIKTRKTAGSSVEIALSRLCGPRDVVTPLAGRLGEESLRQDEGGFGPVNWHKPLRSHRGLREWRDLLVRGRRARIRQHTSAATARKLLGDDAWNKYLTVSIERNPWDRAVSRYWWHKYRYERRGNTIPPMSEYLHQIARDRPYLLSNWDNYADGGEFLVDRVMCYETLARDLAHLEESLAIGPGALSLPRIPAKGGYRPSRHYSAELTDKDRDLIADLCAREIDAFGYRYKGVDKALSPSEARYEPA